MKKYCPRSFDYSHWGVHCSRRWHSLRWMVVHHRRMVHHWRMVHYRRMVHHRRMVMHLRRELLRMHRRHLRGWRSVAVTRPVLGITGWVAVHQHLGRASRGIVRWSTRLISYVSNRWLHLCLLVAVAWSGKKAVACHVRGDVRKRHTIGESRSWGHVSTSWYSVRRRRRKVRRTRWRHHVAPVEVADHWDPRGRRTGGHDVGYWRHRSVGQLLLGFLALVLVRCWLAIASLDGVFAERFRPSDLQKENGSDHSCLQLIAMCSNWTQVKLVFDLVRFPEGFFAHFDLCQLLGLFGSTYPL